MSTKLFGMAIILMVLVVAVTGCSSLLGNVPGMNAIPGVGGSAQQQMWPDVPAFEGASQDPKEALGTSLFNQAQSDQKSKMETLIFRTSKMPADVAAFYTADLMKAQGWTPDNIGSQACTQDKIEGLPRAICQFKKKDSEGRDYSLSIDARVDDKANNTRLIFVRTAFSLITK